MGTNLIIKVLKGTRECALLHGHKPHNKGRHSREPENVSFYMGTIMHFTYRLKLYALFINGENEAALYTQ
jgi:hypothetical protein